MRFSTDRLRTTHTGSLPRPASLVADLDAADHGRPAADLDERIRAAVGEVVRRQVEAGIDIVGDGEASKISYSTYVKERLDGFSGTAEPGPPAPDFEDFPDYMRSRTTGGMPARPVCTGRIRYRGQQAVRADIANLRDALAETPADGAFMTAASPGVVAHFLPNRYYETDEAYLWALADAMKVEYDEIHAAGLDLQLDCPDLTAWHRFRDDLPAFHRRLATRLEVIGYATRDIPPDRLRLHLCWGNYEAPHTRDIPLAEILRPVLDARPAAISFEAANPRHAHEWTVFEDVELPEDKMILPGVLDSTTNYVEHPELVAQRLERYAALVGRERVAGSSDCGFATTATSARVHPTVVWAKLAALAEGARLASQRLWKG
ncbi:cobalamin-independent methionine synthase II family protein [Fodinicola acaciae]|uniref:cobalamin-independent methionine synthase II family protein n=1 Tax=Fodinicola acaciae TaxID=2681555 RepID=UPI0016520D66|nr:cobalamin-independent methionine synthase II family protein [Fodinicola acaciae]